MAGFLYQVRRSNFSLSTTVSAFTIIPAAARHCRIRKLSIVGATTTSGFLEVLASYVNAAGTGGGTAITPRPLNKNSPAAAFTVAFNYVTLEPTILNDAGYTLPFNGNGGVYRAPILTEADYIEIAPNTNGVTLRSLTGTTAVTLEAIVEEL